MSSFDPVSFLDATITEPSVKRPPIPAGLDLTGTITDIKERNWTGKEDPTKGGKVMDVFIQVDLTPKPELVKLIGQPTVTLVDGIMLDLTEDGRAIDMGPGKNKKLYRYREALDMNKAGVPFSFRAMSGRLIRVKISHREYQGEMLDQVDSVAKA